MTKRLMLMAAALASLVSGCAGSAEHLPALAAAGPASYSLGPGDELRVTVFGLDGMNNTYLVGDTGMVALPMLDPLPVQGKTVREAEAAIASAIRARQLVLEPKVSAQVQSYRPFFILGEVQRPGQYPYIPGMSVLRAVSVAGGYTFRANTKTATIDRATMKARATPDSLVRPGDTILIRESWF